MSNGNWVLSYRNEFGEILVAHATTGGSSIAARTASADAPAAVVLRACHQDWHLHWV